jgi:hypothetical protein
MDSFVSGKEMKLGDPNQHQQEPPEHHGAWPKGNALPPSKLHGAPSAERAYQQVPGDPCAPASSAGCMNYLDGFNPAQRAAAEHTDGPTMVIAGAGSGKTKVLTVRIAHLMAAKGVAP